jgi:hypothetical protein
MIRICCGAGALARAILSRNQAARIKANNLGLTSWWRSQNREARMANNILRIPLLGGAHHPAGQCPLPSFDALSLSLYTQD